MSSDNATCNWCSQLIPIGEEFTEGGRHFCDEECAIQYKAEWGNDA